MTVDGVDAVEPEDRGPSAADPAGGDAELAEQPDEPVDVVAPTTET